MRRVLSFSVVAVVVVWVTGCVRFPRMDLREPIYLVTHDSLFANCEHNSVDRVACRTYITEQVQTGAFEWSRFFQETDHPLFVVVESKEKIPQAAINPPVEIKVQAGVCGETLQDPVDACYLMRSYFFASEIVFTNIVNLSVSLVAHELGHVLLGPGHYDIDGVMSIMSDGSLVEHVQATDIDLVCAHHPECPMRKSLDEVWEDDSAELDY